LSSPSATTTTAAPGLAPGNARRRAGVAGLVAVAILALALFESIAAVVAPRLAPSDDDWRAAAAFTNAGFHEDDLVVAAPAWADPVLRLHLGNRLPAAVAGRLDHETHPRIWELSQRGAEAPEVQGGRVIEERHFGRLRVRLVERTAQRLRYDFTKRWAEAQVSRVESGAAPVACERQPTQHQCPGISYNFVRSSILEIGGTLRQALYAQPIAGATVVLDYPAVPLGRELAVAAGLHNVWLRKVADGTVLLRVKVDGREIGLLESGNRSGWKVARFDTSAFTGKTAAVRFEITSARPFSRHFGFAAEARGG
jgi:hypothetical protein